ncbi:cytochrome c-type biogenesis protein CcmF [Mucilaginibacter lappiensis]|uniref:Cytochrome c-type biogenesis protein CcmF n=1 Tax=Mucilaginibacter lappiensis TaxID=354630 RepID=A0ABR6PI38_9SPHI|nr:cytochrome c biogenesis protein CcsA [Mucilaginibacter lappiensis]MBB6108884.1 cytochrome c-type biogenesis protein CcmF [Mucilaginibacter lappiensis]SIQ66401.1 cytochrome c-type biogenesis protein CcmF [Mucilaginibacter lappiensis]
MDTVFKGEHLLPGQIGQFFIVLSFGAALISFISYYFATTEDAGKNDSSWQRLGRIGFYINSISILGMGTCLFYVIYNHYFEYHYAWAYTSRSLPVYYIVSGFWNGQEGGFLLWTFWQAVLGNILIRRAKSWERPVMTVVAFSQVVLATMVLGVEILGTRVGSSPFLLLRKALEAPIFQNPDYLSFIKDGQGMNPSLQNYWMIIHPPTLFLGFASMVVPFAYAVAGLWQKRYKDWVAPAIPYALFSGMILGTGVIMGAFWAYESLNFGGFWAWDPVENASIFPWITMVAALHVLIVFKNTGHSYFTATFLVLISFVLVWYSSFLSRSGILGDTSVHSFTDNGMFWQLVIGVLIFLVLSVVLLVARWKQLPITKKDEDTYSREFWMFVGSVFLGLSCFHLLVVTSVPVWNAMFGTKMAPPSNIKMHYNVIQSSFAFVITILTGFTQFLKYKKTDVTRFFITTGLYLLFGALITALVVYATGVYKLNAVFILVMWGSVYSVVANAKILADAFKGQFKLAGSAVAHIGFGFLMVGAVIAAGTSSIISINNTGEGFSPEFAKEENPRENVLVYLNQPQKMGDYTVTYVGDSVSTPNVFFKVDYKKIDATGKIEDEFVLKPKALINKGQMSASPDTKHYLFHDMYTHITMFYPVPSALKGDAEENGAGGHDEANDDKNYDAPVSHEVKPGDTIRYRDGYILLKGLNKEAKVQSIPLSDSDVAIGANLEIVTHGRKYEAVPVYMIKNGNVFDFARKVDDAGLKLRFSKVIPENKKVEIMVYQQPESKKKFIVMKAIQFPYINFFWAGTIIMVIGFFMSILRRKKELKTV